jgi:hypothetical protein
MYLLKSEEKHHDCGRDGSGTRSRPYTVMATELETEIGTHVGETANITML